MDFKLNTLCIVKDTNTPTNTFEYVDNCDQYINDSDTYYCLRCKNGFNPVGS